MKPLERFYLFAFFVFLELSAFATHYRAGEIIYTHIGTGYTYQATVITYTKISGTSAQADRDSVTINWGDGTSDVIYRVNGPVVNGFPNGVLVLTDVKKNEYVGMHTYPGPPAPPPHQTVGYYVISFSDVNRLADILNMAACTQEGSVNVPFYVEDTLFFPTSNSLIGQFSSPVLDNPAVQYACECETFMTNPQAVDSAADSITYTLVPCKQDQDHDVPCYIFPDAYCNSQDGCLSPNNSCTINFNTGDLVWNDPCQIGFFNVGILLHIYRHGVCLGTMLRDFQAIVIQCSELPPLIHIPPDTCIRAGSFLQAEVSGTNPNQLVAPPDSLVLSAEGQPFIVPYSPASFPTALSFSSTVSQIFQWSTVCNDIQYSPYFVYFKLQDDVLMQGPTGGLSSYPLETFGTWQIEVIPPPVQGLTATTTHNSVILNWTAPYICDSVPDFHGFSIWRRIGCDPFVPSYCETGLAGTGYVKISANNVFNYTYTDNTVVPGQAYSYRVVAEFYSTPPNGDTILAYDFQESVPSLEVCVNAPVDVPVILNADVNQTGTTNGQIYVRWWKPLAGGNNLDTLADPPVYRFDLYRSANSSLSFTSGVLIGSWTFSSYSSIPDTVSTMDSLINTVNGPWSYKLFFYANNGQDTIGTSTSASSTFLTLQPSDRTMYLRWNFNDPWSNDSFAIYRQNHITLVYDSIGKAYTNFYADTGLINDTTYCYYVKDFGEYTSLNNPYPAPLINRSEMVCNAPVDTIPPCPPVIYVTNDCGDYQNQPWDTTTPFVNHLGWQIVSDSCDINLQYFNIYFSANDSGNFVKIDSNVPKTDTSYNHLLNNNSLAGCYAITAVSRAGFESKFSNVVCVDNCPYYVLPNAFTPNGDGHNDLFHPFLPYRFIAKIDMKIYNRWGELVFQTNDPMINWDGNDLQGKPVSEAVYLYAGYYYEQRLGGLVRMPLSGEKKGGGFIQLIRK